MEAYIIIYIPKMDAGHSVSLRIMHSDITAGLILIIDLQFAYDKRRRYVMNEQNFETKENMLKRLRRIEGQVKGIHKMIEEDKYCADILTQVAAVRAAINKVGSLVLEKHSMTCIQNAVSCEDKEKALKELVKTMQSFMKFA